MTSNALLAIASLSYNNRDHESDEEYANNNGLSWGILIVNATDCVSVFVAQPQKGGIKLSSTQTLDKSYLTFGHKKFSHINCPTLFNKNNALIKSVNLSDLYLQAMKEQTMEDELNEVVRYLRNQV